jgi:hypothetical protein
MGRFSMFMYERRLSFECLQSFGETRFFAGRRIFVDQAFGYGFVQAAGGFFEKYNRFFFVLLLNSCQEFFHSRAHSGFLGSVACAAHFVGFSAFDCGFDVRQDVSPPKGMVSASQSCNMQYSSMSNSKKQ